MEVRSHEGKEAHPRASRCKAQPLGIGCFSEGKTVTEVARHFGITETTWYRWKSTYGGMKAQDVKKLKELEIENRKLKIIVGNLTLDNAMLKELAEGNF